MLLFLAAAASPLAAVLAAGAATAGKSGFTAVCRTILDNFAGHHVLPHQPKNPPMEDFGFDVGTRFLTWGAVIFRQKKVQVIDGPGRFYNQSVVKTKQQKFFNLHFENWNYAKFSPGIPNLFRADLYSRLELDFDLTPWAEQLLDRKLFAENQKRVERCAACIRSGMAFCDWKIPLGSLWNAETMDLCVEPASEARAHCQRDIGIVDDLGEPVRAIYHSPEGGLSRCSTIDFVRANHELKVTDVLERFLKRH